MQHVDAFKDYPGGLFPAQHEPIIDLTTWEMVQRKLKKPEKERVIIDEKIPLRGVLKCFCGKHLTGAPSRGKLGNYYYYYKCNRTNHLNLSAIKAHDQLRQVFGLMSLPDHMIRAIQKNAFRIFENKTASDKLLLAEKKKELEAEDSKLFAIEEKWISNKINQDTYERWFTSINNNRISLKATIEHLSSDQNKTFKILQNNLEKLSDLEFVFNKTNALEKQELINLVFDHNLYYQEGMYRTPTMIDLLSHNYLIMREKDLLEYKKKRGNFSIPPLSGLNGLTIEPLIPILTFLESIFECQ